MNKSKCDKIGNENCPNAEFISAYLDNELDCGTAEAKHIASCSRCTKQLEEYRTLDTAIKAQLCAATPRDLDEKIKSSVAGACSVSKNPKKFPLSFMKIAAMLLVSITITFVIINQKSTAPSKATLTPTPQNTAAKMPANARLPVVYNKNIAKTAQTSVAKTTRIAKQNNNGMIPLEEFSSISFGNTNAIPNALNRETDIAKPPVVIDKNIRQVWIVNNLAQAQEFTGRVAKYIGVNPSGLKNTLAGNVLEIRTEMTKKQVVCMVRILANAGFELLSPQAPQPEQDIFTGKSNEKIYYQADFVLPQK